MKQQQVTCDEIKLVGISVRTNNKLEMTPGAGRIPPTIQRYDEQNLAQKIPHRKHPRVTYCVYTDYESDENGEYTYFVGEEVSTFGDLPEGFRQLSIPHQKYAKFTSAPGPMPQVCIDLWKKIWQMTSDDLGGKRNYQADFELYDKRAKDPKNTVLDIYIGVQ